MLLLINKRITEFFFCFQVNWVITDIETLFCKPPDIEGDPVISGGIEHPPGTKFLTEVYADAIAYFGFYIPLPGTVAIIKLL